MEVRRPKWLPREQSLGLKAGNLDLGVTFPNLPAAEANAKLLLSRGYRHVEIFDREAQKPIRKWQS
jgi:hypothetical protein